MAVNVQRIYKDSITESGRQIRRMSRGIRAGKSFFSRNRMFSDRYKDMKSFYGRELLYQKGVRKNLRFVYKFKNHIEKYHDEIVKIQQRYMDDPDGMSKHLRKVFKKFLEDLTSFVEAYKKSFQEFHAMINLESENMLEEADDILSLLQDFYDAVKERNIYIPPETIKEIHREIKRYLGGSFTKIIKKEEGLEEEVLGDVTSVKDRKSLIKGYWRLSWLEHKTKKLFIKDEKEEIKDLKDNIKKMQDGISNIDATWLSRYQLHLKNLTKVDKRMRTIASDILKLIEADDSVAQEVLDESAKILAMEDRLRGEDVAKELAEIRKTHDELVEMLKDKENNDEKIKQTVKKVYSQTNRILRDLWQHSNDYLDRIKENPTGAF